jgi:hypothetical protein
MAKYDDTDDTDVAGHQRSTEQDGPGASGLDGKRTLPRRPMEGLTDETDDTEGHLFSGGPSTQGEAFPKPNDNPHGDR